MKGLIAAKPVVYTQGAVKVYQQIKQNKIKYKIILRKFLQVAFVNFPFQEHRSKRKVFYGFRVANLSSCVCTHK